MIFRKILLIVLAVIIAFAALFTMLDVFGKAAPAAASGQERAAARAEEPAQRAKPTADPILDVAVVTTGDIENLVQITDLSGAILGEGLHIGRVKCTGDNCSQRMTIELIELIEPGYEGKSYEYKFSSRLAISEEDRRVVVGGVGTLTSGQQKERFTFTATFEDNRDGSFASTYVGSRPDVSFIIPRTRGSFVIGR